MYSEIFRPNIETPNWVKDILLGIAIKYNFLPYCGTNNRLPKGLKMKVLDEIDERGHSLNVGKTVKLFYC